MVKKKSAGKTNFEESSRPVSEEEPVPIQSIDPLAIVVYNPENVPPVESTVSTESDTSDKDQQVEENPEDGEVLDAEEIPNVEKTLRLKKIHLVQKQNLKKSM